VKLKMRVGPDADVICAKIHSAGACAVSLAGWYPQLDPRAAPVEAVDVCHVGVDVTARIPAYIVDTVGRSRACCYGKASDGR